MAFTDGSGGPGELAGRPHSESSFQEPIYDGGIHAMGRRIHNQRTALRILQDLTDRSNAQARYRAEHARRVKAAEEARRYRRTLCDFADALAEIAKDTGTSYAKVARDALDKEAWLGR